MAKFRTAYSKLERVQITCSYPGRTHQDQAKQCNINEIMKRAERGAVVTHLNKYQPKYGDTTSLPASQHEAMNIVKNAENAFASLPEGIKKRFNDDPKQMLEFLDKPENRREAAKLGLLRPEVAAEIAKTEQAEKDAAEAAKQSTAEQNVEAEGEDA